LGFTAWDERYEVVHDALTEGGGAVALYFKPVSTVLIRGSEGSYEQSFDRMSPEGGTRLVFTGTTPQC
jgi:hypothetical protein